jgi:hypothetical protein
MKLRGLLPVLLCACAAVPKAVPPPASEAQAVRELLRVSGTEETLASWRELADVFIQEHRARMSDDQSAALDAALSEAFDPERLREAIVARFLADFEPAAARAVEAWYRSDFGRKIVDLELETANPDSAEAVSKYAESLRSKPPAAIRVRLIRRFDAATGLSKAMIEIQLGVGRSIADGFAPYVEADRRLTPEELDDRFEQLRLGLEVEQARQAELRALYAQRSLSIVDVAHYVEFVESPAAAWFFSNLNAGLVQAVTDAAEQLRAEIDRVFAEGEPPAAS